MKKNIQSVSETYICPKKAGYKFRSARKFHTPLYLYGVTGIGKTALILNNVNMKKCRVECKSYCNPGISR